MRYGKILARIPDTTGVRQMRRRKMKDRIRKLRQREIFLAQRSNPQVRIQCPTLISKNWSVHASSTRTTCIGRIFCKDGIPRNSQGPNLVAIIKLAATFGLYNFHGIDEDEGRACRWVTNMKTAFKNDQVPEGICSLVVGGLLTSPEQNWNHQPGRSVYGKKRCCC